MPGAVIVADQMSGAGAGVPGQARNDLWLSRQVDLSVGTSGNSTYQWDLLDKPPGSSAVLATPTAATSNFIPDVPGTYRIRLITNNGGAGNIQILVLAVRYDSSGALIRSGWRLPALGESGTENNFNGQTRGWAEAFEKIVGDISTLLQFDTLNGKLTVSGPETVNQGTSHGQANTREAQIRTTDSSNHVLVTFPIPQNSIVLCEVEVLCIKADASVGGYFKKSRAYLRKASTVSMGTQRNVDKQFILDPPGPNPTWDVTLDEDSGNARVMVNSQGDDVTWYVVRQALRALPVT